ncbi:hypothetical protein C5B42_00815 [Candidatus Cerribacteria bacterium 'Amazon FNV 2010 28 9']|uniref:Glycosyltransferase 2-like domain-containing protein n=1 Tax=Candidatus Cerribacteria bacterium 'Amazon FNV 2010 28 9' TaxID=2081795 RepID=A0A317JRA4_9BACT|nr:MAG: hypothetical protein C5B42_00815 [Candidatus Cerribacteria bacterium 'Amazon FNV 2010 28 9']
MPTITALVHTRNSANALETCLQSLQWCNEIWVIDMESSDRTLDIAKKYATKIFKTKAAFDYADPIRNIYIQKVTTDWLLIVDHDEEVPKTLAAKIQTCISIDGINGYQLPRLNIIFGEKVWHTGFWPDYIIRLIRTGKGSYPPQVHGQPIVEGRVEAIEAKEEYALIHHHYPTIESFLSRANIYTSLEVEKILKETKEATPLFALRGFFEQFHTRYFALEGYKDGNVGFSLSLLLGAYTMIARLKAWEKMKQKAQASVGNIEDVETEIAAACSNTSYWVANEKLKEKINPFVKLRLLIKRKLSS